tara:strand:+ start:595 stop:852 length:258 start_codon:yes stop_codon:yes gene_type:complete
VRQGKDIVKLQEQYKSVFESKDGQVVLAHICKVGYVLDSTFVPGDSHGSAHNEGMRRLALSILKFLKKKPEDFSQMLEQMEANNE